MRNTRQASSPATAGSGGAIADANAEASICPKGWKLPTSGPSNNSANDSFYNLLVNYGLTSTVTGSADGVNYNIATTPLYFVRSGYINIETGDLKLLSHRGEYWSSLATTHIWSITGFGAYTFVFNASGANPSNGPNARYSNFPLRCLARRS